MSNRNLLVFIGVTFAIGWLLQGLAVVYGFQSFGRSWALFAMWSPLAAAVLSSSAARRELWSRVKKIGWWYLPAAVLAGWSFGVGQQLLLLAVHHGHWNSDLYRLTENGGSIDSIQHLRHMLLGTGPQGFGHFAQNLVLSFIVGSLVTMIIGAIGEEAGWRGVLQPELARRFGDLKGTLMVGVIWGYWHLPINLAGLNDAQHPVWGSLLIFPLLAIAMSYVLAWLVKCSGSVWPAALGHGANNVLYAGLLIAPNDWFADQWTAVAAAVLVGGVFAWLLTRASAKDRDRPEVPIAVC